MKAATVDDAAAAAPAAVQWVVFRCAGERFGLPLDRVREIMPPRPFTRLPGAGPEVCGLVGVRGRVVTAIDLGVLLGGRPSTGQTDHRLLLLDIQDRRVAVVVEDVVLIAPAAVRPPADNEPLAEAAMGICRTEDGTFAALDPVRLLERLLQQT